VASQSGKAIKQKSLLSSCVNFPCQFGVSQTGCSTISEVILFQSPETVSIGFSAHLVLIFGPKNSSLRHWFRALSGGMKKKASTAKTARKSVQHFHTNICPRVAEKHSPYGWFNWSMYQRKDGSFFVREEDTWHEKEKQRGDFLSLKGNTRKCTRVTRIRHRSLSNEQAIAWIIERFVPEFWQRPFANALNVGGSS
jgi:hypothetical protein